MPRRRQRSASYWRVMIAGMIAGVFGVFAVAAMSIPAATDAATNCRLDRKDPAHTVILIDQSDPFRANDVAWVRELVEAEARALPRAGRLTVVQPDLDDPYAPRALFSACSTGSPDRAHPVLSNPRMIEDTWRAEFRAPVIESVEMALRDTRQPQSPLMETLFAIADRPDFRAGGRGLRLVIVSDLMQHSQGFSFYRAGADPEAYGATRLSQRVPDLSGTEVVARIVPRDVYDLPLGEVRAFWRGWFAATGADYGALN
ncbi:MAG: hypothetical protein GVY06_02420 [Alphaproteobacteria bacterium]|nr:hypothetical protein [Alphaproteobacteria bacterium]